MPDSSLQRVDFSLAAVVSNHSVGNFPTGAMTISFWIKWRPGPGDVSDTSLISYSGESDPSDNRGPRFLVMNPANLTIWLAGESIRTGLDLGDGNWHHIAISMEPNPTADSVISIHRDGSPGSRITLLRDHQTVLVPGGPFKVSFPAYERQQNDDDSGDGGSLVSRYTQGLGSIAEVRVWNGVRTQAQIQVEMTGYLRNDPQLRLYWQFGFKNPLTSYQAVIPDDSGNGHPGQFMAIATPQMMGSALPWPAAPMNLAGVNLAHSDIEGIPIAGRNLSGAALDGANLSGADLSNTNLSGATARAANLQRVNLTGANFAATDLTGTDLSSARFSPQPAWSHDPSHPTILEKTTLTTAILGRDWSGLRLTGANVTDLKPGTDLSGINCANMFFQKAAMSRCVFRKVNFAGADLTGAQLNNSDLTDAVLRGVTLYGADMSTCTLTRADLTNARLGGEGNTGLSAVMSYAYMPGATLTGAELYGVNLDHAQIYANARMDGAHLEDADLNSSIMSDMNFTQAHLKGVNFSDAVLVGASFRGVDMSPSTGGKPTNLAGAHLEGADFTSAKLYGANLSNASVALAPGTLAIQRLDDNGFLVPVNVDFGVTIITADAADSNTVWPDHSTGPLNNPSVQLVAAEPPGPPPCIPSLTSWCPAPGGN